MSNLKFKSLYSDKLINATQYIAELMCERISKYKNIDLPKSFWNSEVWRRDFMIQLRFASQLIKLYSIEAILNALKTNNGKKIYSLGAKWLDPLIKNEQNKIDKQNKNTEEKKEKIKENNNIELPINREIFNCEKSMRSKLDG